MNSLQLTIKQMRQRFLSSSLTWLSVTLGVALAIAILLCRREGRALFGQTDYGYDVLVGPKASPLQLVLNTAYHLDKSPGNISYAFYESLATGPAFRPFVRMAVPYAVGDSYRGYRIVGTLPKLFGRADDGVNTAGEGLEVRPQLHYEFAAGQCFNAHKFEAVIGSEFTQRHILALGDKFHATHGMPAPNETPDIHAEEWTVVGILKPTHTANDHVLFIPLLSFYAISEHEEGMQQIFETQQRIAGAPQTKPAAEKEEEKHYVMNPDGTFDLKLPKEEWIVSAVLIKARGPSQALGLISAVNNGKEAVALNPASVMREFFSTFLDSSTQILLLISGLVIIVASIGILVSIYNSVVYRQKEIAIFRALGATRRRILVLVSLEAGLIGLLGGIAGVILGHLVAAGGSVYLQNLLGQGMNWVTVSPDEWLFALLASVLAALAGLVPAIKAYRTPVAANLVAS